MLETIGVQEWDAAAGLTDLNLSALRGYLADPDVFEVRINKYRQVVCDTVKGRIFHDDPAITEQYVASLLGHLLHINQLDLGPINNVQLPDGSRCIFCLPPAVIEGTTLVCIRKHLPVSKSLEELRDEGRFEGVVHKKLADQFELKPFEKQLLKYLDEGDIVSFNRLAVMNHLNIAVAGATGSGKTTYTRTLLREVPPEERVILLEDVHEVDVTHLDEVGYMLYGDQAGRLSARAALKACMRLSPDRIFMTELRDEAAWDYLSMSNTGHPGGIFSTHADSATSTPLRVATLVKESKSGAHLDWEVIMKTVTSAIDVVIFMEKRQVKEILYDPIGKRRALSVI